MGDVAWMHGLIGCRRNGDFARFIAEYQQEPGESSTDPVDGKARREQLAVCVRVGLVAW